MQLRVGNDGFPVLDVDQGVAIGALPFTKWQFETLWAKSGCQADSPLSDDCYAQWIKVNPRPSRRGKPSSSLMLWLTGITPTHAQAIVSRTSQAFLPDSRKWLEVEKNLNRRRFTSSDAATWLALPLCDEALAATRAAWGETLPKTWAQALLLQNGILEWVSWQSPSWNHERTEFASLGSPKGTTFTPQINGPLHFQAADRPTQLNGFRIWNDL